MWSMKLPSPANATLWLILMIVTSLTPTVLSAAEETGRLKPGQKRAFHQSTEDEDGTSSQKRWCDLTQSDDGNMELSVAEPFHVDACAADISDISGEKQDVKTSQLVAGIAISDDQLKLLGQQIFDRYNYLTGTWGGRHFNVLYELILSFEDKLRSQCQEDVASHELRRRVLQPRILTDTAAAASELGEGARGLHKLVQYKRAIRDDTTFSVEVNTCSNHIFRQVEKTRINLKNLATPQYERQALIELATDTLSLIDRCCHNLEQMFNDNFGMSPDCVTAFIVEQLLTMVCTDSTNDAVGNVDVDVNDENATDTAAETMEMDK